jgi:dihydroxyacid dehydratase/phosphogluconate dehydratase
MQPTTMMFRNLTAMDVEESIRANPIDGVVLLCGCDKTTPAQLMGAASADVPAIVVPGGPMLAAAGAITASAPAPMVESCSISIAPAASQTRNGAKSRAVSHGPPATAPSWAPPLR